MTPSQNVLGRGFSIFLLTGKWRSMDLFIATLVLTGFLSMTIFQIVRNLRFRDNEDERTRTLPVFLFIDLLLVVADVSLGGELIHRLTLDLYLSCIVLFIMTSSIYWSEDSMMLAKILAALQLILALYYFSCDWGVLNIFSISVVVRITSGVLVTLCVQYCIGTALWVRQIKHVVKGNAWSALNLVVDGIYIVLLVIYAVIPLMFAPYRIIYMILCVLLMSMIVALYIRISTDRLFVLCGEHERRIVESMNISSCGSSIRNTKTDIMYRDIYDRVVALFENDKLYLNSELSINEIVKIIFTNRAYISRAINQYTGRNFCQFVNSYRINHAINYFRENPDIRMTELASISGFNTVGSFNTAFKYHMCENPSDWCRKERARLLREKK